MDKLKKWWTSIKEQWEKFKIRMRPTVTHLEEKYISDNKSALLTKTIPLAHVIIYTLLTLIVVGLIWAYFSKIQQIAVSPGKVIPSSQIKLIQSLDGGVVESIDVKDGEYVKKGQPLVHLDEVRYKSDYDQAYAKFLALTAMVARLNAEATNSPNITFPDVVKNHPELTTTEIKLFQERKTALKASQDVQQKNLDLANKEVGMFEPLVKKGYVSKLDYYRAQRNANEIKTRMMDEKDKFMEAALSDLNARKADLDVVTQQLTALRDRIERATIRSPVAGIVKKVEIVTVGGVIRPGETIMQIVPLEDYLLVEAHVHPNDIGFIRVGESATVKISTYDFSVYGGLRGKVTYISPDAIEGEPGPTGAKNTYYIVHVKTDKNYLGGGHHKMQIMPGMVATVHIETGENTVLSYLLKPLIKAQQEALREK